MAVAPLAGAWIEIRSRFRCPISRIVAPLAGAWIEIEMGDEADDASKVAPLAGAWIEIITIARHTMKQSRSPCGSVD